MNDKRNNEIYFKLMDDSINEKINVIKPFIEKYIEEYGENARILDIGSGTQRKVVKRFIIQYV